jgi:hypothetical protein
MRNRSANPRRCEAIGCERVHNANGYCTLHGQRYAARKKAGWPEPIDVLAPLRTGRPPLPNGQAAANRKAQRRKNGNVASKWVRDRNRKHVIAAKSKPCMDCHLEFPWYCMDFDHRPGEKKLYTISQMQTSSLQALFAEMAKCDVVCAICHRIRTVERLGSKPWHTK